MPSNGFCPLTRGGTEVAATLAVVAVAAGGCVAGGAAEAGVTALGGAAAVATVAGGLDEVDDAQPARPTVTSTAAAAEQRR